MDIIEKTVSLIEHGYSKEEIAEILGTAQAEPEAADPAPEPEPAPADPAPEPEPATEPEPAPADDGVKNMLGTLQKSISDLTAAVQSNNIRTMSTNTNTVDDMNKILASYINPPGRE